MTVGQAIQSYLKRQATRKRRGGIKTDRQTVKWCDSFRDSLGKSWRGKQVEDLVTSPEGIRVLEDFVFRDRPRLIGVPPTKQTIKVEDGRLRACFQIHDLTFQWTREGRDPDPRQPPLSAADLEQAALTKKLVEDEAARVQGNGGEGRKFYRRKDDHQPKLPLQQIDHVAELLDCMADLADCMDIAWTTAHERLTDIRARAHREGFQL